MYVTILFLILFLLLCLWKQESPRPLQLIARQYKPRRAELVKDTRREDLIILIILVALIIILGMKAITMMVIVSDSMKPEFQRGDIILSQSFDLGVSEGDIITFNAINSQYAITHRVIEIKGDRIITRGDANPWNDEYYTTQKDVIFKSINLSSNPIVIKGIGNLFITDYSKQGMIYKFGDQYDFMQKLSSTIKIWGWVITMIALSLYIVLMKR